MKKAFDAIVVGGGPAGATCARELTAAGLDTLVLDRKPFPRDKVCAGWITPAVVTAAGVDLAAYAHGRVLQPIRAFRTGLMHGASIETRYDEIVSYGIRRCEFDDYLLQHSGATLALGEQVTGIRRAEKQWWVNDCCAPILIGAGGYYCPVARHLGADLGRGEQPVIAKEIEFLLDDRQQHQCAVAAPMPELWFTQELDGYGWCFRKGHWLNIGLGFEGNGNLSERVRAFMDWLVIAGRIPADLPAPAHGHAYLLYRRPPPRPRVGEGVLLVGDAAGLAFAQSGEGIRPAVESALLAARTVIEAAGDYSRQRLLPYEERLHARLGPGEAPSRLPPALMRLLGRAVLGNRLITRWLVLERWFLHRHMGAL